MNPHPLIRRAAVCVLMLACACAAAQDAYPSKPVQFIVPTGPGGGTDTISRLIGRQLGERLKWQVVVVNRLGAGTRLASESVAKAAPDGYTLLMGINAMATGPIVFKSLPYDLQRDFTPVTLVLVVPYLLVVHPSLPVKSAKDLLALAKARPGQITYASAGVGATNHLTFELMAHAANIKLHHVPYKFGTQGVIDVMAGHITTVMTTMATTIAQVRAGKLRALAVTSAKRDPAAPDIPALAETIPGYEVLFWTGLMGPGNLPRELAQRLQREVAAVLRDPQTAKQVAADGGQAVGNTPEEFAAFYRADIERWDKLGRTLNIPKE